MHIVTNTYRCADTRRGGIRRAVGVIGEAKAVVGERLVKLHGDTHDQSAFLRELVVSGKVTPEIDRTYALSEVPAAIRCFQDGKARGKIVIVV
jgi:NADPH:quinone reductase-like Zn-dependent oxidoreductase